MKKTFTTFLLPLFFLTACAQEETTAPVTPPAPTVKVMQLNQMPAYTVSEMGTVKAGQDVDLVAQAGGTISGITAKVGDPVTLNQTLAVIGADKSNSAQKINLENAQLQLKNAEQNLGNNKANNLENIVKAQLRINSLSNNLVKLNRNLTELQAQNQANQTSLELQRNTLLQNQKLANSTYTTLLNQFDQTTSNLLSSAKNSLDATFVNLDSNFAKVESILNPEGLNNLSPSDVKVGLGENSYTELSDAVNTYSNYRWNLKIAKSNYQSNLPLTTDNASSVLLEARQRTDEMRILLAEVREMLNQSTVSPALPAEVLEAYKGMVAGAEGSTLGDIAKMDAVTQSLASIDLEQQSKLESTQTNQISVNNQLAEAENALQKFYITSSGSVQDLQNQVQQTELELLTAQSDLATAQRTAGIMNSGKDLEVSTLTNQVKLAQGTLEDTKINATMDGVLSELSVENGDYVAPGTRVGKIIKNNQVTIVFYLSEENAKKITVGQAFEFNFNHSTEMMTGTIAKIAPTADPQNKKVRVEGFTLNTNLTLKPESTVMVTLDLAPTTFDPSKVYAPMNAVIFGQNEKYVYVVENELAVKRKIETGNIYEQWVEVTSGLSQTDLLIVDGQRNLPPEGNIKVNYGQNATPTPKTTDPTLSPTTPQTDQTLPNLPQNPSSTGISPEELLDQNPNLPKLPSTSSESTETLYPLPESNGNAA